MEALRAYKAQPNTRIKWFQINLIQESMEPIVERKKLTRLFKIEILKHRNKDLIKK
jgi:hypothetical protein